MNLTPIYQYLYNSNDIQIAALSNYQLKDTISNITSTVLTLIEEDTGTFLI